MTMKITVAGAGIDIEASSLQEVAYEENQDWTWCEAESRSGIRCDQNILATGVGDIFT
jgi:hypothetical protein